MNLANKLTILRLILIPFFLVTFYITPLKTQTIEIGGVFQTPSSFFVALIIFLIAAATDWIDGYIARKYDMITDFGKFMDPLADKLLVTAALLIFIEFGLITSWIVFVILAREFIVTGFRTIAASKGVVIAAGWSGKVKTVLQFVLIIFLLTGILPVRFEQLFAILVALVTVLSGMEYTLKNLDVLK